MAEKTPENRAETTPETRKATPAKAAPRAAEAEENTKTDGTSENRDDAVRSDEAYEYLNRTNPVAMYLQGKMDRPEPDLEGNYAYGTDEGNKTE